MPRPGSKGMLNRHIPEVGSFEWLCAYRGMCEDAQDCQVQEDGDPQGGSHLSTTQRAGISRRSGFPALPAHSSLCTEIPGKPAHSGYTRLTCPYFRAGALVSDIISFFWKTFVQHFTRKVLSISYACPMQSTHCARRSLPAGGTS